MEWIWLDFDDAFISAGKFYVIQTWHSVGDSVQIAVCHTSMCLPSNSFKVQQHISDWWFLLPEINRGLICDYILHSTISFRVFGSTKSFYFYLLLLFFVFNLASLLFFPLVWTAELKIKMKNIWSVFNANHIEL